MASYPITPKAAEVAVEEAAQRSYDQAVEHLRRAHGIGMGKELLENVAKTVGAYWLALDHQEYQQARAARRAPAATVAAERCLVFADGTMAHTDGDWHEVRVGTVHSTDGDQRDHKSSIARLCDVEELGQDLWRRACQMGYPQAQTKAFIADGSHWLWNLAEKHFPWAVKIVDFFHVCEHVGNCAKEFSGEGTDATRLWSLKVSGTLRAGQVEAALKHVEELNPRSSPHLRQAKHELVTYLTNNHDRMDYPRYEAMGLPIGSGEVEAQCKTLVQARCKQAGMRWTSPGLESLLRVRCAVRDGRYAHAFGNWPTDLAAWQARRKRQRRLAG